MMKFEKKHEEWIYDEFKTQSGIGIKEIRYGIEPGRRAAMNIMDFIRISVSTARPCRKVGMSTTFVKATAKSGSAS